MSHVVSAGSIQDALLLYKSSLSSNPISKETYANIDIPSLYIINPLHFAMVKNQHDFIQLFLNLYPQESITPALLGELLQLNTSKNSKDMNKVYIYGNICITCLYVNIYTCIHIYLHIFYRWINPFV
jgi:hypothetical protein